MASPFVWGSGGRRLTPEDIERERIIASRMMASDYSPIQSPWQGLARVSENVLGAMRMRGADRASQSNQQESDRVLQALMGTQQAPQINPATMQVPMGGTLGDLPDAAASSAAAPSGAPPASGGAINPAVLQALANPNVSPEVREVAGLQYRAQLEAANRRPREPHFWETNNGSLGMIGPDGQPQIVYQDPTPRIEWITANDPATGERRLIPVPQGGAQQAPPTDPSYWSPIEEGGPTPAGSGGFP